MLIKLYDCTVHDTKDGLRCSSVIYFEEVLRNLDLMYLGRGGMAVAWNDFSHVSAFRLGLALATKTVLTTINLKIFVNTSYPRNELLNAVMISCRWTLKETWFLPS
jgi:hypothetical protein